VTNRLTVLPGIRLNYDHKNVDFSRRTYGGLQTADPALIALQRTVYNNQEFTADIDDLNFSGQLTANYQITGKARAFTTYSLAFKPVGLNLGGLPTANGLPPTELAVVKPERVRHLEAGFKSEPFENATLNFTVFNTDIYNYQTLVQSPELGVNRGYLSNADQVRIRGVELETVFLVPGLLRLNATVNYTDGRFVSFKNAPLPLEETGLRVDGQQVAFKDISGGRLPSISKWSGAAGAEFFKPAKVNRQKDEFFLVTDLLFRSEYSSSPSPSQYLNIDGYSILNGRAGFRTQKGISLFAWSRNLSNPEYFELLLPCTGNADHFAPFWATQEYRV
jgi:iron complex outermembrane receptor protein